MVSRTNLLHQRRCQGPGILSSPERITGPDRPEPWHRGQLLLIPRHSAGILWWDCPATRGSWIGEWRARALAEGDLRKTLRSRPGKCTGAQFRNHARVE